jgi:hypothetical protein
VIKQVEDKEGDLFKRTHLQFLSVKLKGSVWHNQSTDSGYKLGSSYAYSYAQEIRWANILKKSEFGRKILQRFNDLEEAIEKAKEFISLEELKRKVNLN